MKQRLTERQNQGLEFVRSYFRTHNRPPTLQEIGDALDIRSTNGVYKLLQALEKKGYVTRTPNEARGLQLVEQADDPFALDTGVPNLLVISRTASDQPQLLRQRPGGYLSVDPYFLRGVPDAEACLIARAGDDGMNGEGLHKGDFLVVEELPWRDLRNGDLAACLVREELLARRFHFANQRLHLRPADRTYTELTFSPDDPECYVVGRVVSLLRKL